MELWVVAIPVWILCGFIASTIARNRGLDSASWGCLGFLLGPLGIVLALVQSPDTAQLERSALSAGEMRKCPSCAELVRREAVKCRYCGTDLEPLTATDAGGTTPEGISLDLFPNPHYTGRFNCRGCNTGKPMKGAVRIDGVIYCADCAAARGL